MELKEKLLNIQQELKAPKERNNRFGGYFYRSTEDILTALKPLLKKYKVILTISDTVEMIGERYYIKATACLEDTESESGIGISAYAREQQERKKSDESQLTGAASSYARKYALNGLFLIDDSADPDTYEDDPEEPEEEKKPRSRKKKEEEDFMAMPEGEEEEQPFFKNELKEDTYFYIEKDDNYVMKRAGDEAPEGGKVITKEEFQEGCNRVSQETKPVTRRSRKRRNQ